MEPQKKSFLSKPKNSLPTIGLLVDWLHTQYQLDVFNGASDFARDQKVNLLCFEGGCIYSSREYEAQRTILFDLVGPENVDGLIIMSASIGHFTSYEMTKEFCQHFHPLPVVSIAMEFDDIPSVLTDNKSGFRDLLIHLIEVHGFTRFAFIGGPDDNQDSIERFRIFQDVLKEFQITFDDNLMIQGDFTFQSGGNAVKTLLDKRKAHVDVIIAASDDMALGALDELNARDIQVPEDIALVGFDNLEIGSYASPPLTTVDQSFYEQGRRAAEMVLDLIRHKKVSYQTKIPTKMVARDSCGCFSELTAKAAGGGVMVSHPFPTNSILARNRKQILAEIVHNTRHLFSGGKNNRYVQLIDPILDALFQELEGQPKNGFLKTFARVLRRTTRDDLNLFKWQEILSELRRSISPFISDPIVLNQVEDLWHQARVLSGEMAILKEKRRIHESLENSGILNLIREELLFTLDMDHLVDVLAKRLPETGVKSFFMSAYDDPDPTSHMASKLILAFNEDKTVTNSGKNITFPSRQLVPSHILPKNKPFNMVVVSLNFAQTQFGLALFDIGLNDVGICSAIRRILCSAIQGVTLFNQVQEHAKYWAAEQEHLKNETRLRKVVEGFIKTIALTVETRDPYTAGHQFRVADLVCAIGDELALPKDTLEGLRMASIVHDLGKIYIPVDILNRPGRLRDVELNLIKIHPQIAYDILKSFEFPWPIAEIILQHHERLNGSGYPSGLRGDQILFEAKILAVADVIEAMASYRPYRPAMGIDKALQEISDKRGILYDPEVVDVCLRLFQVKGFQLQEQKWF
jgi:HD-GYP domain-containing protein (c-di-GMP phosphodiesterase class II)/DNA-binding LacI/PurR family transcriptional regulator